ncbi:MAG: hypothetical protein WD875_11790 [Pirellulales bacterium]
MHRNTQLGLAILVAVLVASSVASALAADTVTVRTSGGSIVTRNGTVVDYTASELRLRPAGGRDVVLPADQIVRIEAARSAAHDQAETSFGKRAWREAAEQFADAIRGEERPWVRREMLARMVRCYRALGDGDSAGKVFLQLVKSDATADQFAAIPLAWQTVDPLVVSPQQARAWLDAVGDPAANLLGASHLLATTDADDAMAALQRLTSDRDLRIALLADAQRWRTIRTALDDAELARRQRTVERIDASLRGGPYFALGQSLLSAGKIDEAVAALLRVPIGHAQQRSLPAAALASAGSALREAGRTDEANVLFAELQRDYAEEADAVKRGVIRLPTPSEQPRK